MSFKIGRIRRHNKPRVEHTGPAIHRWRLGGTAAVAAAAFAGVARATSHGPAVQLRPLGCLLWDLRLRIQPPLRPLPAPPATAAPRRPRTAGTGAAAAASAAVPIFVHVGGGAESVAQTPPAAVPDEYAKSLEDSVAVHVSGGGGVGEAESPAPLRLARRRL